MVLVIVIIIVGIWLMIHQPAEEAKTVQPDTTAVQQKPSDTAPAQTPSTPATMIQNSGSSNASLNQDSAAIDAQLKTLDSDTTAANQTPQ